MQLSLPPVRIVQLPITCDTLLLTTSVHYNVVHRHVQNP